MIKKTSTRMLLQKLAVPSLVIPRVEEYHIDEDMEVDDNDSYMYDDSFANDSLGNSEISNNV